MCDWEEFYVYLLYLSLKTQGNASALEKQSNKLYGGFLLWFLFSNVTIYLCDNLPIYLSLFMYLCIPLYMPGTWFHKDFDDYEWIVLEPWYHWIQPVSHIYQTNQIHSQHTKDNNKKSKYDVDYLYIYVL